MPSSTYHVLNKAVENILKTNPKSVLDVGVGYGKWGFMVREYIECWQNRCFPDQWIVKLEGVEIFTPYIELNHVKALYDKIYNEDAYEFFKKLDLSIKYDLTMSFDCLEHMTKDRGMYVGEQLIKRANKSCILNVPTGDWMGNMVVADNPAEQHQAIWEDKDLLQLGLDTGTQVELYQWVQGSRTGCMAIYKKK